MNCSISMHANDTDVFYTVPDTNEIMKILQNDFNVSVNSSCAHPPPPPSQPWGIRQFGKIIG